MATGVVSRASSLDRRCAKVKVLAEAEHEAVQDVVVAVAAGPGDHTRGRLTFHHPCMREFTLSS